MEIVVVEIDSVAYSSVDAVLRSMLVFDLIYSIIIVIKRSLCYNRYVSTFNTSI